MKRIKQILEFLGSLRKAWPILITAVSIIISAILWILEAGRTPVKLSLPLFLVVALMGLCLYPILAILHATIARLRKPPFEYQGLLWRRSFFFFRYPQPLCPIEGCGRDIFIKEIRPPSIQIISGSVGPNLTSTYEYECALHGQLQSVPNMSIEELQIKARLVQRGH